MAVAAAPERRPRPPREGGGATEKGAEPPIPDRVPATAGAQRRCPHLPACHHHHCPGLVASQQPRELTEGESSLSPGPGAGGGTVTTPRFPCSGRFSPGRPRGRRRDRQQTLHESKTDRARSWGRCERGGRAGRQGPRCGKACWQGGALSECPARGRAQRGGWGCAGRDWQEAARGGAGRPSWVPALPPPHPFGLLGLGGWCPRAELVHPFRVTSRPMHSRPCGKRALSGGRQRPRLSCVVWRPCVGPMGRAGLLILPLRYRRVSPSSGLEGRAVSGTL